jgi:ABC-type transporter Mla subunit MlaD
MSRVRLRIVLGVSTVLLVGCGEAQVRAEHDLCAQYDQLVDRVDSLQTLDPVTVTVDELRVQVDDVQDQLDALQAVSEGRLDTLISTLRTAVHDFVVAAADAGEEALDTARPLLEDTLEDVGEAWATLQQVADVRCEEV